MSISYSLLLQGQNKGTYKRNYASPFWKANREHCYYGKTTLNFMTKLWCYKKAGNYQYKLKLKEKRCLKKIKLCFHPADISEMQSFQKKNIGVTAVLTVKLYIRKWCLGISIEKNWLNFFNRNCTKSFWHRGTGQLLQLTSIPVTIKSTNTIFANVYVNTF